MIIMPQKEYVLQDMFHIACQATGSGWMAIPIKDFTLMSFYLENKTQYNILFGFMRGVAGRAFWESPLS